MEQHPKQSTKKEGLYYNVIKFLHGVITTFRKNIGWWLVCVVIVLLPLLKNYFSNRNTYKASFTVVYDELFRKIYGDRLHKLNTLLQKREYGKIAEFIHVTPERAKNLIKIEGKNILGEDLSKDLNTDRVPFIVNYMVKDSTNILEYQDGIVKFLETGNAFLQDRKKLKEAEFADELKFIDAQLSTIDSMKHKYNLELLATYNKNPDKNNPEGKSSIFEFSLELYKRKQEIMRKQTMPQNLYIVDDAIVSTAAGNSLIVALLIGVVGGSLVYALLVYLIIPAIKFREE